MKLHAYHISALSIVYPAARRPSVSIKRFKNNKKEYDKNKKYLSVFELIMMLGTSKRRIAIIFVCIHFAKISEAI